jgi:hypothetical protein
MNWRRIVLGDNWRESLFGKDFNFPRDLNLIRDTALMWPLLLFSMAGVLHLLSPKNAADFKAGWEMIGLATLALLAAKERFALLGGALAFCALRLGIAGFAIHDRRVIAGFIACSAIVGVMIWRKRDYKPSYDGDGLSVLDLVVGITSLLLTLVLIQRLTP